MRMGAIAALAAVVMAQTAYADTYNWPAQAAYSDNQVIRYFPAGTPIMLKTESDLSTKQVQPGERVYLRVAEPVVFHGQVVVPVGAPAVARVVRAEKNGHLGKEGKLAIELLYMETPMGEVALTGGKAQQGESQVALSVGTILFVSIIGGYLIHGTSASIPYGTAIQAYTDQPLRFAEHAGTGPALGDAVQADKALALQSAH